MACLFADSTFFIMERFGTILVGTYHFLNNKKKYNITIFIYCNKNLERNGIHSWSAVELPLFAMPCEKYLVST